MAPLTEISRNFGQTVSSNGTEPISRTMQYRKITKPLLERQRRARINRCLDELKDILINGLQAEGENVARLEKADILELTVRHLHKLQSQQKQNQIEQDRVPKVLIGDDEKFRSGFAHCAQEVSRALASAVPRIDLEVGTSLMVHLGHSLNQISTNKSQSQTSSPQTSPVLSTTTTIQVQQPKYSPISPVPSPASYRPYTPPSSPEEYYSNGSNSYLESPINFSNKIVWRPW